MKTKHNTLKYLSLALGIAFVSTSCTRDNDPDPVIPPSDGSTLTLNGGPGEGSAENSVYVDLSADQQTAVKRTSWDLGFYSGSEFRVILNGSTGASAMDAGTTDLAEINSTTFDYTQLAFDYDPGKLVLFDDTAGRIDRTVIAEIATDESANNVYVVNTTFGSEVDLANVWKVRILRDGNAGYTLQYAELDATEYQTLTISKDGDYLYKHVSFSDGPVEGFPKKADWDFEWGYHIFYTSMGPGVYIPYAYSDLIFINNLGGVSAAEIVFNDSDGESTGKPNYTDFTEADLSAVSFDNSRNVIGSKWRVTPSPTPGIVVGTKKDRFYLIKDAAGNIYKLRFNSFTSEDGGKRGYPELEYQLVKQG